MVRVPVKRSEGGRLKRIGKLKHISIFYVTLIFELDFRGSICLVLFLVLFLLALSNTHGEGPRQDTKPQGPYGSLIGWPLGAASLVFLAGFIVVEKRYAREPIMPLDVLHDRTITGTFLSFMFMNMGMYAAVSFSIIPLTNAGNL